MLAGGFDACIALHVCTQGECCATLREALACSVGGRGLCYNMLCERLRIIDTVTYMIHVPGMRGVKRRCREVEQGKHKYSLRGWEEVSCDT